MVQLILGTGSNQGNRAAWLNLMADEIGLRIGRIAAASGIVESAPWGYASDSWFLNQVLLVETPLSAKKVLAEIHGIESGLGRIRTGAYADRNGDIDILFYDQQILELPGLQIPHPQLEKRRFVLMPLAELLPEWIHPVSQKTMLTLLEECGDSGPCRWYSPGQSSDLLP